MPDPSARAARIPGRIARPMSPSYRGGLLQVALAGVLWGTGGLTVQLIRREQPLSPLVLSAERMLIGAAAVLVVVGLLSGGVRDLGRLLRRHPVGTPLVGAGTGTYQALYFVAVTHAGVAVATVVSLGVAPVLLAGHAAVRRRAVPSRAELLVLATALSGLLLVSWPAGDVGPRPVSGVLLALASGATYAATTAVGRRIAVGTRPTTLTAGATLCGAVVLAPLLLVGDGLLPHGPVVTGWLLYLGVATMAGAYLLLYAGLRTVPAGAATLASLLEPVTAALAAWLVLDERLGLAGVVGVVLVLAAVAGLGRVDPAAVEPAPAP